MSNYNSQQAQQGSTWSAHSFFHTVSTLGLATLVSFQFWDYTVLSTTLGHLHKMVAPTEMFSLLLHSIVYLAFPSRGMQEYYHEINLVWGMREGFSKEQTLGLRPLLP
jgi:hypothetical protein